MGIPKANIEALIRLQQSGVKVALASGRMAQAMYDSAAQVALPQHQGYIIASNGAFVEALSNQHIIRKSTFQAEQIQRCALSAVYLGAHFTVDQGSELYYTHHDRSYHWLKALNLMPLHQLVDVQNQLKHEATRCSVSVDDQAHVHPIDAFMRVHHHEASFERLHPSYLDIMPLGNSKWIGLEALMNHLHIERDEVAAIGDGENDRSMLARVGFSATLQNASESLKSITHVVVAHVADAGVAQFAELVMARNAFEK